MSMADTGMGDWTALRRRASQPYRRSSLFAWRFALGKLGIDPVFRALIEAGEFSRSSRVLDVGCGQGLLASLLWACQELTHDGRWPARWPPPADRFQYTGIDLMQRDIARARQALEGCGLRPQFVCADMCSSDFSASDLVVILDVLHYVEPAAQRRVLERVRAALSPEGRLLLRIGDSRRGWRFGISQWVDRVVTWCRGHGVAPTYCRSLPDWCALLGELGFAVEVRPMSAGTPFANVLLACRLERSVA